MLKEFRDFIARGNMLDLAVGVIIGGAFTGLVTSLTTNLISPLIGMFVRSTSMTKLSFTIFQAKFTYGAFLNDIINFLITAFVVFLLIKFINKLVRKPEPEPAAPAGPTQEELLTEIRDLLKKDN
ncbi:large-conductance mechanosensitive channel protein MscL [Lacticaseibacillus sharpeae]|uniref:Large-conductance mechanosensitive channel n=1 Tax=Lacticaseibacillus sharpeae JCM 1186 = DSM 20505 TaxID=1291052 RepID=A0A0R1ZN36_9LACO|nr:large-conductance mechanosensitive channel protein MscL [Lacticaseibacillus sharpeae]KRM55882.1 large-conductance mechanosensitive channel [Lacticaseibacillus sharpeae JCM 1186 = DSM 20505]